jgi:hypothetical protein
VNINLSWIYRVFHKVLYNGIPNNTVWGVMKTFTLKGVQTNKQTNKTMWRVRSPLSVSVFVTLATQ